MKAIIRIAGLGVWVAVLAGAAGAQENLRVRVMAIATEAKGEVSTACLLPGSKLNCSLNEMGHPPMQSVFKLPVAVTALHQVEGGKLSLNQKVRFLASDRILPSTYSPLQEKYPKGEVDIPLEELLRLSVSESDNVAADIVLRTVGGPSAVNEYITSLGVVGLHIEDGEDGLARDSKAQFRNWFEPIGAVGLLDRIANNSPLTPEHNTLLLGWMEHNTHGEKRIPGDLPPGTVVAHKTGTSGVENGVAFATNDIGLITLPDGRKLAVAVFITNSHADEATRDAVIAKIARAAYNETLREAAATPKH